MKIIKKDDIIKVHYTGTFENGEVFDSSLDREPLEVKVGDGKLISGFDNALIGMRLKEKKTINLKPKDAYGVVNVDLIQKVERINLPDEVKPEVGLDLVAKHPDGYEQVVKIIEVADNHIVIDANHPLAGKTLIFSLEIVEIV